MADFSYNHFLNYNAKNKPLVRRLAEGLRHAGLCLCFDERIIKPSDILVESL